MRELSLATEWTWLLATLFLLLLGVTAYLRFSSRLQRSLHRVNLMTERGLKSIEKIIETNLRPNIYVHDSKEMVTRRAAEIIKAAAGEKDPTDRRISFYGAAALSAPVTMAPSEIQDGEPSQEEESPADYYARALEIAARSKVQMRRYISLFSPEELRGRNPQLQGRYLEWLKRQQAQLANDELYQLVNVVRAPKWGANMARIITKRSMMEITGNGRAAVIVVDEEAAKTIREYARSAILGDNSSKNRPTNFGLMSGEDSIAAFRTYVTEIEKEINTRPSQKEGEK